MNNFLDNIYNTFTNPQATFKALKQEPSLIQALYIVIFVSIISILLNIKATNVLFIGFNLFSAAISGIISWLFFGYFVDTTLSLCKPERNIKSFLTTSAFALLPWILLPSAKLFKTAGEFGTILAIILGFIIWIWSISLIFIAISKTYEISFNRTLLFLMIPFIGSIIAFNWTISFFITLGQIIK